MTTKTTTKDFSSQARRFEHTKAFLDLISLPGEVREIRIIGAKDRPSSTYTYTLSGYYDEPEAMALESSKNAERGKAVYFTLNSVEPELLARADKTLVPKPEATTEDRDILARRLLLFDFDAKRKSNIPSSDDEHQAALDRTREARDLLRERGWPEPVFADSGNGGHLLYRIDLPAEDGGIVQGCLKALGAMLDDDVVQVDQTVFNPARICKLYGTMAKKGTGSKKRPHRYSMVLEAPGVLEVVPGDALEALAALAPEDEPKATTAKSSQRNGNGSSRNGSSKAWTEDAVEAWLADKGLTHKPRRAYKGGSKWVLDVCPLDSSHTDKSAVVTIDAAGVVGFRCQHNSCLGSGWVDVRRMLDADYRQKQDDYRERIEHGADVASNLMNKAKKRNEEAPGALPGLLEQAVQLLYGLVEAEEEPLELTPKQRKALYRAGGDERLFQDGKAIPAGRIRGNVKRLVESFSAEVEAAGAPSSVEIEEEEQARKAAIAAWKAIQKTQVKAEVKKVKAEAGAKRQEKRADPCIERLNRIFAGVQLKGDSKGFTGTPPTPVPGEQGLEAKPSPEVAWYLQSHLHLMTHTNRLWLYRNGRYQDQGERLVRHGVQWIDESCAHSKRANEVVYWLENENFADPAKVDTSILVNVQNGLLDPMTGKLHPHTPEHLSTIQLPVSWDPEAYNERADQFLQEVLPDDGGQTRAALEEALGYILLPDCRFEKAVMLTGSGGNGKSVFLVWLQAMLGAGNVSNIRLQDLSHNFRPAGLVGKLANIFADLPKDALKETDGFKMLVSGDTLTVEEKYKQPFSFSNRAKLLFSANEMPRSPDRTPAFWRRWIVVPFPNAFKPGTDRKPDPQLKRKLTEDPTALSYLLRLAVEGLQRLLRTGRFTESAELQSAIREYQLDSDPLARWLSEETTFDADAETPKDALWTGFKDWLLERGHVGTPALNTFVKDVRTALAGVVTETRPRTLEAGRQRCFKGIRFLTELEKQERLDEEEKAANADEYGAGPRWSKGGPGGPLVDQAGNADEYGAGPGGPGGPGKTSLSRAEKTKHKVESSTAKGSSDTSKNFPSVKVVSLRQPGPRGPAPMNTGLRPGPEDGPTWTTWTKADATWTRADEYGLEMEPGCLKATIQGFAYQEVADSKTGSIGIGRLRERLLEVLPELGGLPDRKAIEAALEGSGLVVRGDSVLFEVTKATTYEEIF